MARCKINGSFITIIFFFVFIMLSFENSRAIDRLPAEPDSIVYIETIDPDTFYPTVHLAIGLSKRIDERSKLFNTEVLHVKLNYHVSKYAAVKYGLGHSINTKFKSVYSFTGAEVNNFMSEVGFRWSSVNRVKVYLETSLMYNYYYATNSSVDAQRIGINISAGLQFNLYENIAADLSIGHTVNNINTATNYINPEDNPSAITEELYEGHLIGIRNGTFYQEIYNPTAIRLLFFYKL